MGCALCSGQMNEEISAAKTSSLLDACVFEDNGHVSARLKVKEVLGVGGFGLVREVQLPGEVDPSQSFAMKSVSKHDLLCRSSGVQSVFQELQALRILQLSRHRANRFICQLHLAFQDSRYVYLVLDLCPGGDLRCNLNRALGHRFSESIARFFFAQVVLALDACHKVGPSPLLLL